MCFMGEVGDLPHVLLRCSCSAITPIREHYQNQLSFACTANELLNQNNDKIAFFIHRLRQDVLSPSP
jgi:hypothetical protein